MSWPDDLSNWLSFVSCTANKCASAAHARTYAADSCVMRLPDLNATLTTLPERYRLEFSCGHAVDLFRRTHLPWSVSDQATWVRRNYTECVQCLSPRP